MLFTILQACTKSESSPSLVKPANCDANEVISYSNDIQTIMNDWCVRCHYAGSGIYDYSSYEVVADRARSGRMEERLLMPKDEPLHMPEDVNMNPCALYKLRLWIHQGAKNN
jgi:hypothetical protein